MTTSTEKEAEGQRLLARINAAEAAITEIMTILSALSLYHISNLSGASFTLDNKVNVGYPDTSEVVVEVKRRIDSLRKMYAPMFVEEFKALSPKDLSKYSCFSTNDLFKSTDFIVNLNITLEALDVTRLNLWKKHIRDNAPPPETDSQKAVKVAINSILPSVSNLFDKQSTEKAIAADIEAGIIERRSTAQKIVAEVASSATVTKLGGGIVSIAGTVTSTLSTGGDLGTEIFSWTGATAGIIKPVSQTLLEFAEKSRSWQYPKGTPFCNPRREELSKQRLTEAQATAAQGTQEMASSAEGAGALPDIPGLGVDIANASLYKELYAVAMDPTYATGDQLGQAGILNQNIRISNNPSEIAGYMAKLREIYSAVQAKKAADASSAMRGYASAGSRTPAGGINEFKYSVAAQGTQQIIEDQPIALGVYDQTFGLQKILSASMLPPVPATFVTVPNQATPTVTEVTPATSTPVVGVNPILAPVVSTPPQETGRSVYVRSGEEDSELSVGDGVLAKSIKELVSASLPRQYTAPGNRTPT